LAKKLNLQGCTFLCTFYGQVGIHDALSDGVAIAARGDPPDDLSLLGSYGFLAQRDYATVSKSQAAKFTRQALRFLLDQRLSADEISFVQFDRKAESRLVRGVVGADF